MSSWQGNDRQMAPNSDFKLKFSERPLRVAGVFLFQFGVVWEVWLPGVTYLKLKIGNLKTRSVALTGQRQKNDVRQQPQINFNFLKVIWI